MTVLFGLLAAVTAGTSDFLGGLASRNARAIRVTAIAQAMGAAMIVVVAATIASSVTTGDIAWGAVSGLGGALGLMALYTGYAKARVGIAAPVAGVGAAALPAVVDAFTGGEPLGALALVGVVVGIVAVALVSMQADDEDGEGAGTVQASLLYGLAGGVGLGLLLIGLSQAGDDSGLWPLAASRFAGATTLFAVMGVTRESVRVPKLVLPYIVGIAACGALANGFFLAGSRSGSTAVAAVVTSLFPAFTVGWAVAVFGERLRPVQIAGLALALVSVGLILVG